MTLTQRDVFKRIMTERLRPPKAIRLLMGYSQEHSAAVAGRHPQYVPGCPHKMGNFGLSGYFWWHGLHMPIAFLSCQKPPHSQDH